MRLTLIAAGLLTLPLMACNPNASPDPTADETGATPVTAPANSRRVIFMQAPLVVESRRRGVEPQGSARAHNVLAVRPVAPELHPHSTHLILGIVTRSTTFSRIESAGARRPPGRIAPSWAVAT